MAPSTTPRERLRAAAAGFAFVASAAGFVSIAVSHTSLAAAIVLLGMSRVRIRFPPVAWPLGAFLVLTGVSMLASGDPAAGWPQVKKVFVFAFLPALYSLFRELDDSRRLVQAWFVACGVAVAWSFVQFGQKFSAAATAGDDFLTSYAPDRITGFFSHWMTFSQGGLLAFVTLLAFLMFSRDARRGRAIWTTVALVIGLGLTLSFTRSVWLALVATALYFIWHWNRRLLWAIPPAVILFVALAPAPLQQRVRSIGSADQNRNRLIMWEIGLNMIRDHPWLGVGPERVGGLVEQYKPSDVDELPAAYWGHLHNIYIHYAAERGLLAAAAIVWLLLKVMFDHARALKRSHGAGPDAFLLHAAVAATLAVMLVGCFDLTLGDSEVLGAYLSIVALGYAAIDRTRSASA